MYLWEMITPSSDWQSYLSGRRALLLSVCCGKKRESMYLKEMITPPSDWQSYLSGRRALLLSVCCGKKREKYVSEGNDNSTKRLAVLPF